MSHCAPYISTVINVKLFLSVIIVTILRVNTIEQNIAFKEVEIRQNQWQLSCHHIRCKVTLTFSCVYGENNGSDLCLSFSHTHKLFFAKWGSTNEGMIMFFMGSECQNILSYQPIYSNYLSLMIVQFLYKTHGSHRLQGVHRDYYIFSRYRSAYKTFAKLNFLKKSLLFFSSYWNGYLFSRRQKVFFQSFLVSGMENMIMSDRKMQGHRTSVKTSG